MHNSVFECKWLSRPSCLIDSFTLLVKHFGEDCFLAAYDKEGPTSPDLQVHAPIYSRSTKCLRRSYIAKPSACLRVLAKNITLSSFTGA
jgi:hypothetical protein